MIGQHGGGPLLNQATNTRLMTTRKNTGNL
jgi:hypothetical protein